jgi:hypothetical protein
MGTQLFPAAVAALGRETVVYLAAAPTNSAAITVAEANAAATVHLTCVVRGFAPTADQAKTRKYRLCSTQGFDVLGRTDWSIERPTFIDEPQALDNSVTYPHKSLVAGTTGYILRRRGLNTEPGAFTAFAAGQRYDFFPVTFGVRVPVPVNPEEEGQEFEYMQEIAITGQRIEGVLAA